MTNPNWTITSPGDETAPASAPQVSNELPEGGTSQPQEPHNPEAKAQPPLPRPQWANQVALDVGWKVLGTCSSVLSPQHSERERLAAISRHLRKQKWKDVAHLLANASHTRENAIHFLANRDDDVVQQQLRERTDLFYGSAIDELVRRDNPDKSELPQLAAICREILDSTTKAARHQQAKILWPEAPEFRLKAKSHVDIGPADFQGDDAKADLLRFIDENPWQAPPVQELLRNRFRRGSRERTFISYSRSAAPFGWALASVYPDDDVPVWVYANLVRLEPSLDLLRRKHPCIQQALRISAYQVHGFDPHNLFWAGQHDAFGFLLRDVDQEHELSFLEKVELAVDRAWSRACYRFDRDIPGRFHRLEHLPQAEPQEDDDDDFA